MTPGSNSGDPSEVEERVERARQQLQSGRLDEAAALASEVVGLDPEHREALYLQAVTQRYQGKTARALRTLSQLRAVDPRYARAFQEEGHNHKVAGDDDAALAAFQRAVELNRGLIASWRELAELHGRLGHLEHQQQAQTEFDRLSALPKELVSVTSLIDEGRLFQAEQLCRGFLRQHPQHVEAMRLLALLGIKLSIYDDAEFLLESALEFEPDNWRVRHDYVGVLHRRQKFEQALDQASRLREQFPGKLPFELAYANESVAVGDFDTALQIYDQIIENHPQLEQPYLARGHALKTLGRLEDGIDSYRRAYQARPDYGDAYWSLANLKTYRFEDREIEAMGAMLERAGTALIDRVHLCFALGKAHEDRKEYESAFAFYDRGNGLKQEDSRYDPNALEDSLEQQAAVCSRELFESLGDSGCAQPDPIFIVGLPRAGSTLLEQILASHSQVDGTMELPNIIALANKLNGRRMVADEARYPAVLSELTAEQFTGMGEAFLRDTSFHRQGAPRFIDKMPNNFQHLGLIHLILPRAKIIDARRHPMACCFSGFKQLFADGQEFTYGQREIARYYQSYVGLMAHWDRVLPGAVLRVHYEHVVDDLEGQVRRILEFLELPFEDGCLEFHRTERSVRTPSSEQVRQPIYQSGLEQWRNFEPWLGPMKDELGDRIAEYPMP